MIDVGRWPLGERSNGRQLSIFPSEPIPPGALIQQGKTKPGWKTVARKVSQSGNDYFRSETTDWNIMYRLGPNKAALSGVMEDRDRFPVSLWVRDLLLEGVRVLALNSMAMRRPVSPSHSRRFSVDGSNLPLVIQDLQRNHQLAFEVG